MGLLDFFKKKKTYSTFPENELEKCLMKAASDVNAKKEFYQKLLWNQLYVQNKECSESDDETTLNIVTFENGYIPVFTSANRIFDKDVVKESKSLVSMKGQDLFAVTNGATFVLNPYSEYGKELIPEEIEALMDGTIFDKIDEEEVENKKYQEFDEIFDKAIDKQKGLILLDGYRSKPLGTDDKLKLEESIENFKKCLQIVPAHWQSMVMIAKSYQRLERHTEAFEYLEQAFNTESENHTIPMEASLEAMHLKDIDKALFYSEESLKRKPDDFVLMGNYAMNLLIANKDDEAKEMIEKAIKINPNDKVNRNIRSIVSDVIAGERKRPTFEDTIR
ncbi:MAG: SseB family protein [Bacteroidales bacterium]|jgi:tetratricopeptide (TPR) repeat protein|nr:SseB family protein [Bacteroidales bacterium]